MQYDDAFTIQKVEEELVQIFNQMAGMVPFIQKLIADVSHCISPNQIVDILINWYSESNRFCFPSVYVCFVGYFCSIFIQFFSPLFFQKKEGLILNAKMAHDIETVCYSKFRSVKTLFS